ncbi:MAG: hypothetical protein AB9879_02540 [Methanothrix sp.]
MVSSRQAFRLYRFSSEIINLLRDIDDYWPFSALLLLCFCSAFALPSFHPLGHLFALP